jgi:hypothetical protein
MEIGKPGSQEAAGFVRVLPSSANEYLADTRRQTEHIDERSNIIRGDRSGPRPAIGRRIRVGGVVGRPRPPGEGTAAQLVLRDPTGGLFERRIKDHAAPFTNGQIPSGFDVGLPLQRDRRIAVPTYAILGEGCQSAIRTPRTHLLVEA